MCDHADCSNDDLTERWLRYARRIVDDDEHRGECARLGGSPDDESLDAPDLRWPGYLGEDYRPGGLLCIANVHRGFRSGGLELEVNLVREAVEATWAWRDRRLDDRQWLRPLRAMYARGLAQKGWAVARYFFRAYTALGENAASIAYSNTARCQHPSDAPKDLLRSCLRRFPLSELVEILTPRLVLTSSEPAFNHLCGRCPVLYFNQRNGNLCRYAQLGQQGTPAPALDPSWDRWTEALVELGFRRQH